MQITNGIKAYYNDSDKKTCAWLRELIIDGLITPGEVDDRPIQEVKPVDLVGFQRIHMFAGIAGWDYALNLVGWGSREVWTGSCPCQPFSSAGKGKGTADERHLWPQFFRLINQCRPHVVFGEQVASKAGLAWLDGVFDDLEVAAYSVWACDTCAASVGAPHIRQRLYWVADTERRPAERRRYDVAGEAGNLEGQTRERERVWPDVRTSSELNGLAHADQSSDNERPRGGEQSFCDQNDEISGVVQPDSPRPQQGSEPTTPDRHRDSTDSAGGDGDGLGFAESEQTRIPGFSWRQSESIPCSDGKSRRIESGTFPLVARLSETVVPSGDPGLSYVQATAEGRAMRLRGYGNAIIPQVAAEFIRAHMEANAERKGER